MWFGINHRSDGRAPNTGVAGVGSTGVVGVRYTRIGYRSERENRTPRIYH